MSFLRLMEYELLNCWNVALLTNKKIHLQSSLWNLYFDCLVLLLIIIMYMDDILDINIDILMFKNYIYDILIFKKSVYDILMFKKKIYNI